MCYCCGLGYRSGSRSVAAQAFFGRLTLSIIHLAERDTTTPRIGIDAPPLPPLVRGWGALWPWAGYVAEVLHSFAGWLQPPQVPCR